MTKGPEQRRKHGQWDAVRRIRARSPGYLVRGQWILPTRRRWLPSRIRTCALPSLRSPTRLAPTAGYQCVVGRRKTTPAPDAQPATISSAYVSHQRFTDGFYGVFARLALEHVNLCVYFGDTMDETGSPCGRGPERLLLTIWCHPGHIDEGMHVDLDAWDSHPSERPVLLQSSAAMS